MKNPPLDFRNLYDIIPITITESEEAKNMKLWNTTIPYYDESVDFIPELTPYIKEGSQCAIVVCPGGGYTWRAPHEGGTIAEWLNTIGVSAFVLDYRVAPYKAPAEGSDVQRAMRVARAEAEKYG